MQRILPLPWCFVPCVNPLISAKCMNGIRDHYHLTELSFDYIIPPASPVLRYVNTCIHHWAWCSCNSIESPVILVGFNPLTTWDCWENMVFLLHDNYCSVQIFAIIDLLNWKNNRKLCLIASNIACDFQDQMWTYKCFVNCS